MSNRATLLASLTTAGCVALLFGCGGSSGHGGGSSGPLPTLSMNISPTTVAANGSSTAVITLTARDTNGKPIPGEQLTLQSTGTGNILTQPGLTDDAGVATGSIASTVPETKKITAIGPLTSQTATGSVTFTPAPLQNGVPANLGIISGNNQSGAPGSTLPQPLVVRVTDASGNGVANVPVIFTVITGNGTLSGTQTETDQNGQAAENLALGNTAGNNSVAVAARDFNGNNLQGSPVTFNETGTTSTTTGR